MNMFFYYEHTFWNILFIIDFTMAHRKAAGSAKNLRDSNPKYRWVKLFWGQSAKAWNIIIRQLWSKYICWENTYLWKDFTVHAKVDWIVFFSKKKKKRFDWRKYEKTVVNVKIAE